PIDGNAVIYQGDWTGLKPTDNLINVLSNSNTSRTCEWKCKEGFEISSNKCVPINYTCTGDIDSNAIVFEGDNEGLVENLDKNLVEADGNTSRKCEYYCKEGYYKSGNSCIAYTCINPIDNASYYEGDNLGLILSGEVNSVLSNSNEDRKCEMFCDTNYHREGVACVRDVEVFSCIGTIPNNAELWDEEEELELVVNVTRTLSAIDTQTKCEYKCSNNFKQFNDTCVPKDYVVASCGSAKRNYYPTDDFPIGSLCSIGNPFPSNPALGENINDSTSWICVGDVNASCSAKRVDYGAPIYDACVLKELNVGRDEEGGFFVEPLCDCETELDLSLIDYNNSSNLQINPSKITCYTYPQKTGIGFNPPLTKDTLIQVTGSIKNHVECTNCELVTYYNYVLEKENSFVPDNSFVSLLLVIGVISFVLTRRKRI
ncbi:MAG: hypothetical protein PHY04_00930, partial [Candidatus ainarchaeum sp.]|nr:hypothetical protein [Candidatus ainarchaeum sp.]